MRTPQTSSLNPSRSLRIDETVPTRMYNSMEALPSIDSSGMPPKDAVSGLSTPTAEIQLNTSYTADIHEELEDGGLDAMAESNLGDEDAQSLIELTMSLTASRLKAPETPAVEKIAAMEEYGGFFDSDPETPPEETSEHQSPMNIQGEVGSSGNGQLHSRVKGMSLGELPSPQPELPDMPISPWQAGPKPLVIQNGETTTQGALHGVFSNRTRSLSGGAEALKRLLPKGLPSMAQVGNLFNSSTGHQKLKFGSSSNLSRYAEENHQAQPQSFASPPPSNASTSSQPRMYETLITTRHQQPPRPGALNDPQRPKIIRRVTSHDSLLYHSLSRASSLGDDTRFENQREQVNSRAKAIRDSLQDRSSFRLPQMPTMPSMPRVTSFNFNINFLNSSAVPIRWKPDADPVPDILPGVGMKKKHGISSPAIASGMVGAAISGPETAINISQSVAESSSSNYLDHALKGLTGDIVIMGGYRGSILRSAKTHRQVWVPVKVGLNIRKVDLEVGLEPEDEERMSESIYASGMLQNIGPVDISKRLFKRLAECENARNGKLRIWDYGYDWRLSPHILSRKLTEFLEKLPSNQPAESISGKGGALVVAHSLGGLITRHVVNRRPELFSGVVYAGVPQACVNILGPLRNGDAVLLSSRVLTAQVNFTLRTSFVLLPEDGRCFIDLNTKEQYPVDFFDIKDWIKYRWSPCTDPPLPPRNYQPSGLGGILNLPGSLLSLPLPSKKSTTRPSSPNKMSPKLNPTTPQSTTTTRVADTIRGVESTDRTLAPQMGNSTNPVSKGQSTNQSVSTTVTIPRDKAIAYLERTLADTKKFKQELYFKPSLSESNRYPPLTLIYGKSIPTVYGAKVDGREGIACSDSYDNLAFASGDGVCLAKEAMLPEGYKTVYGGRISSDRGHVTLLGDLNAVGRAISAVMKGRKKGIGLGV